MPALVISIDGPDFCGKTTIANLLIELLREKNKGKGINFKRTEVPSKFITGSFTNLLRSSGERVPGKAFALVYAADHLFHYENSIKPLQESGENYVILQERSLLTTYVYQGILGKVDFEWIKEINKFDLNIPRLTLVLKVPVERIGERVSLDRRPFDRFEAEEHIKRQAEVYYNLPEKLVKKFNVEYVDAGVDADAVAKRCAKRVQKEIDKFFK